MGNYTSTYQHLQIPKDTAPQLVGHLMFLNCPIWSWERKMSGNLLLSSQVPPRNLLKLEILKHPSSRSCEPWIQTWSHNFLPSATVQAFWLPRSSSRLHWSTELSHAGQSLEAILYIITYKHISQQTIYVYETNKKTLTNSIKNTPDW